jgi:hypothetical protein
MWTLVKFLRQGDTQESRHALEKAVAEDPYVVPYLLGQHRLPRRMPEYIGIGDRNEAVDYVAGWKNVWAQAPGALSWLASVGGDKNS